MVQLNASKCPTDELVYTNCAVVNQADLDANRIKHVQIKTGPSHIYAMSIKNHPAVKKGEIAFGMMQRKWAQLSLNQPLDVQPLQIGSENYVGSICLEVDFATKKGATAEPLDSDAMAREFSMQFGGQVWQVGMLGVFSYTHKDKVLSLSIVVKSIEGLNIADPDQASAGDVRMAQLLPNSNITFEKSESSQLSLVGKAKGKQQFRSIINPNWDFTKMGVGGLDNEFSAIFRRAFASRVFPPEFIEQLGMKHVRGILLYGPPGTGKTLMARQIGQMLNAREPKIINGPQILDKYVGESEAKIRALFADAEEEQKRVGANSGLHIIIFDEIDAICKARGSQAGSSSVHDTVVNQLLSKMDGIEQLNNILVIGMTNRRDMIDEALLRPGRLEVQMMIGLPDENGRVQILNIHTTRMREYKKLGEDVNIKELAKETKNFSGAELEGLVRAAQSSAMNRLVKAGGNVEIDPDAIEKLCVQMCDFQYALENDIKPAFGNAENILERYLGSGVIVWGDKVHEILNDGDLLIQQAQSPDCSGLVSVLLEGPANTGKTALAGTIAKSSEFPFVKVISPEDMIGYSEMAKCQMIRKTFDDAYKSPFSCILIDNLDRLLDFSPVGPRYSNIILQSILVLIKMMPTNKKCRLLVLCTATNRQVIEDLEVGAAFSAVLHVPPLMKGEEICAVLETLSDLFNDAEMDVIRQKLAGQRCQIGIKQFLSMCDWLKQVEDGNRVGKLWVKLEQYGNLVVV